MTERDGCIALNLISGIGYVKYSALKEYFGSAAACFGRSEETLRSVRGIGEQLAARIAAFSPDDLAAELELAERGGVRIVTLADADYPEVLHELYDPPLCLYIRGTFRAAPKSSVSIVGSRRMSQYGERMARALATDAAMQGYAVVSGLAYGVDAVAHRAALDANGVTVAVLGGGLGRIHPQEHVPLARRIVETGGALLSEFPMAFPVSRTSFPRRNRIVAALARGTIVVEAGLDSGAMITANLAVEQGRDVFAVPGHADSPQSAGCHSLIRSGATLVENFQQVLEAFDCGLFGRLPEEPDCGAPGGLSPDEARIHALLREHGDRKLEFLAAELPDLETGALLTALMGLEMKLLVRRNPDQTYTAARS